MQGQGRVGTPGRILISVTPGSILEMCFSRVVTYSTTGISYHGPSRQTVGRSDGLTRDGDLLPGLILPVLECM